MAYKPFITNFGKKSGLQAALFGNGSTITRKLGVKIIIDLHHKISLQRTC
jgi:hypothetical protein